MTRTRTPSGTALALFLSALLIVTACGADEAAAPVETDSEHTDTMDMGDGEHDGEFHFGEPADASAADRVIEIEASDKFAFDPDSIKVSVGETVTFRVTNVGVIPHDFTLGDSDMQAEHEAEMAAMSDEMAMHSEPNVFSVEPGETKEMTWHFTEEAELEFGCHQSGHYAAGMKGELRVKA